MTSKLPPLFLCLVLAAACGMEGDKGPLPDPAAGKADGDLDVVEHGDFGFGDSLSAELSGTDAHAWTFTLTETVKVNFT